METINKVVGSVFGQKSHPPGSEHPTRSSDYPESAEGQKYRSPHPQATGPEQVSTAEDNELSSPGYSKTGSTGAAPGTGFDRPKQAALVEPPQQHRGVDSLVGNVEGPPHHAQPSGGTHTEGVTHSDPLRGPLEHPVAGQGQRSGMSAANEPTGFAGQTKHSSVTDTANAAPSSVAGIGGGPGTAVEPSVGVPPAHGATLGQEHQGAGRPVEPPASSQHRSPGAPLGGDHSSVESGTGEKYIRSSGLAAEGGDFDAARAGAGREADRLLEEKGIHHGDSHGKPTGAEEHHHKKGLGEKIKEVIYGKHHDATEHHGKHHDVKEHH